MIVVMSNDQKYYLEATKEFDEGRLDEALWSKMLSVNQGDVTKAKYSYIKQRAKELRNEAVRKSFSNSLDNFKKLIKRILWPLSILVVLALIIFGIIKTVDYTQTIEERAAYQQQLEEEAAANAIARAERAERERIARAERAERAERERIALTERQEKIDNAYQGLDCVLRDARNREIETNYRLSMIINPIIPKIEIVKEGGFPEIVTGQIEDAEMTYKIYPRYQIPWRSWYNYDSYFLLNKSGLSIEDYNISSSKCTPTDHNEIRERVRKEQESIRSGYKISN